MRYRVTLQFRLKDGGFINEAYTTDVDGTAGQIAAHILRSGKFYVVPNDDPSKCDVINLDLVCGLAVTISENKEN